MTLHVVGVVCALASEARHLGPATRRHDLVTALADGTLLAVSGMGRAAAAHGARVLIDAGAAALVSWGMAGGLDPAFAPGGIFLPEEVVSSDGIMLPTAGAWRERLGAAIAASNPQQPPVRTQGRLLTSGKAVATTADKATLFRETGAVAVDMESLSIAEAARAHRLPFLAVRVIVDSAADALPQAVTAAADEEGHLKVWRLLAALARTPTELAALMRLAQRYRAANRSLAAIARVGLLAPHALERAS